MYPGGLDGSATLISRGDTAVHWTVMRFRDGWCGIVCYQYGSWRGYQESDCDSPAKGVLKGSGAGGGVEE
jgi:hypothetical protein